MRALVLISLLVVGCSKNRPVAVVSDAAGVEAGSRVFAEGVTVGTVKSIAVEEGRVRLTLEWAEGHTVALRADACAVVLPAKPAHVLLFPGKDLVPLSPPIPGCREDVALRTRVRALTLAGNEVVASAAGDYLKLHPVNEPMTEPCGALEVSKLRVEKVEAVPVLLPSGGRRVWLSLENRSDAPLSLSTARFVDAKGVEAPHAHLPEDDALFMSFAIPPRTRREVSAVFEDTRDVSAIEFEAQAPDAPGGTCRSRWPF
ncbi:MAG: MCE family protein [Archangium sp.]|nr:MCE family protein [Archangium sp.]